MINKVFSTIERLFRDAKMYELLEGMSEIQRELITKRLPR